MSIASLGAPELVPTSHRSWERLGHTWLDRFFGSDPGLNRFRLALQSLVTIGLILEAELFFVRFTHALQIQTHGAALPAAEAAKIAGTNHAHLVVAMLLGAIIGFQSSFGVMDATARGQLITTLYYPIPLFAAVTFGIAVGGDRVVSLVSMVAVLVIGVYLRRFGARGSMTGTVLYFGDFFGFFAHGSISLGELGWVVAIMGVGLAVTLAVRYGLFYPNRAKALKRTQRSYQARADRLAQLALEVFDDSAADRERDVRRLHRELIRLNEVALMIDAQLADPRAVAEGSSAEELHEHLFDLELALSNVARFAEAMGGRDLPVDERSEVHLALLDIVRDDGPSAKEHATRLITLLRHRDPPGEGQDAVLAPRRFAGSVVALANGMGDWLTRGGSGAGKGTFQPAVKLFGGWLPGSTQVSAVASLEAGSRLGDRVRLAPYTRTAIQIGVASAAAIVLGDMLSGPRFYWALLAVFMVFMGNNNSGEQDRSAVSRIVGTVVGISLGLLAANAVGHHSIWSVVIILASLFLGFYLTRLDSAFMAIGVTVMISQLYVQLHDFSHSLLLIRLEETAIGDVIAIVVVTFVLPLRTSRVLRVAMRNHVNAVGRLVQHSSQHLLGLDHEETSTLRAEARSVDASYQALIATAKPKRRSPLGSYDEYTEAAMRLATASRDYSRDLVNDAETARNLDPDTRAEIEHATATLHASLDVVAGAINGSRNATYTRSAALFDRAASRLDAHAGEADEGRLAVSDFTLIDDTMDQLAEVLGLERTDLDTPAA